MFFEIYFLAMFIVLTNSVQILSLDMRKTSALIT